MYRLIKKTKLYQKYIIQEKLLDLIQVFYINIIAKCYFIKYLNQLIRSSDIINPKVAYYVMSFT